MKPPESNTSQRLGGGDMFDRIAPRYDPMNKLISMGLDKRWRKRLVQSIGDIHPGDELLDVATGTADVAIALAKHHTGTTVFGLDPSPGMLKVGKEKVETSGLKTISLVEGSAEKLPFEDGRFAAITIAFGIRNVPDRPLGLREMLRVLRPGGVLSILELGEPSVGFLAPLARLHVHHIVPLLGKLMSGPEAYRYLQTSIAAFPKPQAFVTMMETAGAKDVTMRAQTFGACHLYTGRKG